MWLCVVGFLAINAQYVDASEAEAAKACVAMLDPEHQIEEDDLAVWIDEEPSLF